MKRAFLFFGASAVSFVIFLLGLLKTVPGLNLVLPFSATSAAVMLGLGILAILDERERKPRPPRRLLKKGFYDFGLFLTLVFGFLCLGWYHDVEGQTWKEIAITAAAFLDIGLMIYFIVRGIQAENRKKERAHEEKNFFSQSKSERGQAYEIACAKRLIRQGYRDVQLTAVTGDFGADILATHPDGWKFCFQCKYYSSNVGEDAVQEVISAVHYYHADAGAVLTTADFTPKARELARAANVALMPHYDAHLDWIDRIEEFDAFMN